MPRKGWPLAPAFGGCGLDRAWRSAEVCHQEIDGEVWPRCNFKPLVFSQFRTAVDTVWRFVTRHQHEKLEKHVRRGNLNGLPNFLDIFRTLNGLLITFNRRKVKGVPVIPHPFVTSGIMTNLDLLMGAVDTEGEYVPGFINSINANFEGDRQGARSRR